MSFIAGILGKHSIKIVMALVIVSLGVTTKWALDARNALENDLGALESEVEQTSSELAQERRNRLSLTNALDKAEQRSQEQAAANSRLSQELSDALDQNREWADGPVPSSVYDSLCQQLNCASRQSGD